MIDFKISPRRGAGLQAQNHAGSIANKCRRAGHLKIGEGEKSRGLRGHLFRQLLVDVRARRLAYGNRCAQTYRETNATGTRFGYR